VNAVSDEDGPRSLHRLIGVYDASGKVLDEIGEWVRARLGRDHCSLCAVTHGSVRMKPEWRRECSRLEVPFDLLHLRERDARVAAASDGRVPCVLADTDDGLVVLLDDAAIRACDGDPRRLVDAVEHELAERGLVPR
jgi:hypothetical protein